MIFEQREKIIFDLIMQIKGINFAIIGGYAVNAFTLPRFSIDCDFVVKTNADSKKLQKFFEEKGFKKIASGETQSYGGNFTALKIEVPVKVTIDILSESVFDRITKTEIPANLIFDYSKKRTIYGKSSPIKIISRVVDSELLFFMKCISSRKTDIRDCFMLSSTSLNKAKMKELKTKLKVPAESIKRINEAISSRQFLDSLQGVYGKINHEKIIQTKKQFEQYLTLIQTGK